MTLFIISGTFQNFGYNEHPKLNKTLLVVENYFELLYIHYILVLNLEIYRKLSNSLIKCSTKRIRVYHILTVSLTLTIGTSIYFISDSDIKVKKQYNIHTNLIMYYLAFVSLFLWYCIITFIRKKLFKTIKSLIGVVSVSFVVSLYILYLFVLMIVKYDVPENIALIIFQTSTFISASFGTFQFLALGVNKRFWVTIKKAWKCKRVQVSDSDNEETPLSLLIEAKDYEFSSSVALFSDLFENITKKSLIKIFVSVSLLFLKKQASNASKIIHLYHKEDLKNLNSTLNLDFIPKIDPSQLQLKEYFPNTFASIREACDCFSIINSLNDPKNFTKIVNIQCEQGGRSASFVFLTADGKLVIKTISKHERKVFIHKMLEPYSKRVLSAPESRLSRIFGAFKLKALKLNFIILENILPNKDFSYIFDLKGSKVDREVKGIGDPKNPPIGVVLKDVNFINLGYKFRMGNEVRNFLVKVLTEDFMVLKTLGIMDYSVLLGLCLDCEAEVNRYSLVGSEGFVISIGVIDFFQEYNFGKVGEKTVKSMFNRKEDISSTNPVEYFIRLTSFISEIFK